jgi:hypothetical protein
MRFLRPIAGQSSVQMRIGGGLPTSNPSDRGSLLQHALRFEQVSTFDELSIATSEGVPERHKVSTSAGNRLR